MKALITGNEGFIGSHVTELFKLRGWEVIGVDSMDPSVHGSDAQPKFEETHVCQYGSTPYSLVCEADVIVILAAQVSVADSFSNPLPYVDTNVLQHAAFLSTVEKALMCGHEFKRVIVASSSSVYGNPPSLPFREDDPCVPTNTYGVSKYAQELITLNWAKGVGLEGVALRFFNVYGPGQNMENTKTGVLSNFAREILAGNRPEVTQDGQQVRDFIYVNDVAEAVCRIAMKESTLQHDVYNVCTGQPTTMAAAAWKLAKALGTRIEPKINGCCRRGDQDNVLGINNRLRAEIEWAPRTFNMGVQDYASRLLGAKAR